MAPSVRSVAPIARSVAPIAGAIAPSMRSLAPIARTVAPIARTMALVAGVLTPIMRAIAPVMSSIAPIARSIAPFVGSMTPAISAITPVGRSKAPIVGFVAPAMRLHKQSSRPLLMAYYPIVQAMFNTPDAPPYETAPLNDTACFQFAYLFITRRRHTESVIGYQGIAEVQEIGAGVSPLAGRASSSTRV